MGEQDKKKAASAPPPDKAEVDAKKRRLLKELARSAIVAPTALALMTMEANACSLTC